MAAGLVSSLRLKLVFCRQLRLRSLPRSTAVVRSNARDQSSSGLFRYVPKKSSSRREPFKDSSFKGSMENENSEKIARRNLLPVEISKNVSATGRRSAVWQEKSVVQIEPRNEVALPDHDNPGMEGEIGQGLEFIHNNDKEEPLEVTMEMEIHDEEDSEGMNALQAEEEYLSLSPPCKSIHDAEKLAIDLLAARAFTVIELRKKLIGKAFSPKVVDTVIKNFQKRGWINDGLYAETFSQSRWSSSSWGPRRIKQALLMKGINQVVVDKAIKHVFEGTESDEDQESKLGMSKLSLDQLLVQSSKQWHRSQDASNEKRKSRVIRWLQYRGFNWGVISFIMKKLEFQDPHLK